MYLKYMQVWYIMVEINISVHLDIRMIAAFQLDIEDHVDIACGRPIFWDNHTDEQSLCIYTNRNHKMINGGVECSRNIDARI